MIIRTRIGGRVSVSSRKRQKVGSHGRLTTGVRIWTRMVAQLSELLRTRIVDMMQGKAQKVTPRNHWVRLGLHPLRVSLRRRSDWVCAMVILIGSSFFL